jgi:hypothetical protein
MDRRKKMADQTLSVVEVRNNLADIMTQAAAQACC